MSQGSQDSISSTNTLTASTATPFSPLSPSSQNQQVWGRLVAKKAFMNGVDLRQNSYTIGRKESCEIYLSGSNMNPLFLQKISKEHCVISRDSTLVPYIKDLSKNGTFLNRKIIGQNKVSSLCDGDIIAIGWKTNDVYQFREEYNQSESHEFELKYKFTRLLGKGAFGEVFLVYARKTCQRYAVKKLKIQEKNLPKIISEVNILKSLQHPCVIHMEEVFFGTGHVFIILEYMEGGVLQERVLKYGKLSEEISKLYMYQMILAVQYLHSRGVIHRDLKPENVLLSTHASVTQVKVTDFGLSKVLDENTVLRTLCGTPLYVAPEMLHSLGLGGLTPYTSLVDVWSLGCILYFMLYGRTPFETNAASDDNTMQNLFARIKNGAFNFPQKNKVSDICFDLIVGMLNVDPNKRINIEDVLKHQWIESDNDILRNYTTQFDLNLSSSSGETVVVD